MDQTKITRLFSKNTVQDQIHIHPKFLHSNLDLAITNQIQKKVEGICNKDGYAKKKSVQLLKRSIGLASSNNTNGYVSFDVLYSVDVCHPYAGDIYPCRVKKINKVGFLAEPIEKSSPLVIVVAKQHIEKKDLLNVLKEGDLVFIKVIGSRFDLGDDKISVVGNLIGLIDLDVEPTVKSLLSLEETERSEKSEKSGKRSKGERESSRKEKTIE
jgi:DNA-directed RNA polymerase subunit E'/Rpb7